MKETGRGPSGGRRSEMDVKESRVVVTKPGDERPWELVPLETSPCTLACPTRINARGYVSLVADGRFDEALALIRERNPFPGVCGRVCPRPCEAACRRGGFDDAIAICALKRFVFDVEMQRGIDPTMPARINRKEKIAVVGAGPAGLAAALDLARAAYPVTIFEAGDEPGGMMNVIPDFRLPKRVVKREVEIILGAGIELVTGTRFGKDITWNTLRRRGYRALLIATGAQRPSWRFPARHAAGCYHALDLLRMIAGVAVRPGKGRNGVTEDQINRKRVVVLGGGMLALDAARSAVRLGARSVKLVTGTSGELVPMAAGDLAAAVEEEVRIVYLAEPTELVRTGGRLKGVRCVRLRAETRDATGRVQTSRREASDFEIDADIVIDAFSREIDIRRLAGALRLASTMVNTVAVDGATMASGMPGVFAAGDMVTGPRTVVEAIASGQKAARGIRAYLEGEHLQSIYDSLDDDRRHPREFALERLPEEHARQFAVPLAEPKQRRTDFREVERGFSGRIAKLEAQRCLRCGLCAECVTCTDICERGDLEIALGDDRTITVHAERAFWDGKPQEVTVGLDGGLRRTTAVRTVCRVQPELCVGCGRCEQVCGFSAARVNTFPGGRFVTEVNEIACKGCGTCVAVCPTGAMDQINFERSRLHASIDGIERGTTRILFVCRWARPEMIDVPEDVRVIEVMCTGRLTPAMIIEAVRTGSAGVMVCGCREDRCHYGGGRRLGDAVVARSRNMLSLLGYDPHLVAETVCDPRDFHRTIRSWVVGKKMRRRGA